MGNCCCNLFQSIVPEFAYTKPAAKLDLESASDAIPFETKLSSQFVTLILEKYEQKEFSELFELGEQLGKGTFGSVFQCIEKETRKECACKLIEKKNITNLADLISEIQIMYHLSGNPNVVSIKQVHQDSEAIYIVMELSKGGELFSRLEKCHRYREPEAAKLIKTIVKIVQSLHSAGVMHRDIKLENFLFVNEDQNSPLKIIDFGMSTFFKKGDRFQEFVGTHGYEAPELLQESKTYGPEADIWSVGVILYTLLSGKHPFRGKTMRLVFQNVLYGKLDLTSNPWNLISDDAKDLVRRMLDRNGAKRITTSQILRHPWLDCNNAGSDYKRVDYRNNN